MTLPSALAGAIAQELVKDLSTEIQDQSKYAIQFPAQFSELREQLKFMQSFVADASKLKDKQETVKMTLQELQKLIYEADDLVVDCQIREDYTETKASSFSLCLSEMAFRYKTGKKLTEINSHIKRMRENLNSYYTPIAKHSDSESKNGRKTLWSSPVFDQSEVVGLTENVATIRDWILGHNEPLLRLAIVGLGVWVKRP
nr:disease resistance RPP13-like protein 4 [Coffea arabica]